MTDQELQKYVQDQLAQGIDPAVLRMALEGEGLSADQINQALAGKIHSPAIQVPKPQGAPAPAPTVAPTTPVAAAGMPIAAAPVKKGFFAHKAIIISVLVILALAAGGAYAYTTLMLTPEKISQKMLTNLAEINSVDYDVQIKGTITESYGGDSTTHSGEVKFRGTSDLRDVNDPKASLIFDFISEDFGIGFEARILSRIAFFKLTEFPDFDGSDKAKNQWVKVDIDDVQDQYGSEAEILSERLSAEQIQKINDAYIKYPLVKLGERIGTETLDNTSTYHYKFTTDKTNALNFLKEMFKIVYGEAEAQEYSQEMDERFTEFFKMVDMPEGDVWVAKKDYLPRKLVFTVNINVPGDYPSSAKFDFVLQFSNFNNPTQIEAPSNSKDFKEFYEELTGEAYVDPVVKSEDSRRVADTRQLQTALELYYNDNGGYPPAKNGQPDPNVTLIKGNSISFKDYISIYPTYPPHSGNAPACDDNKTYVYARPNPNDYSLTFCLESTTGGYTAGDHVASPAGIN
jgi:hypothetical protein